MAYESDAFVQQLKDKLNIVDVISGYVTLQRRGRDFWACCPFHHEKTPSFQVKTFHQVYVCYGCGKRGDVINFVMEMDNLTFPEALEKLARQAGLEMPERTVDVEYKKRKEQLEKIYAVNRDAAVFYHSVLRTPEGEVALRYLAERELTKSTITKFGIGYSPDYTSLITYLKGKGYSIESMRDAGVVGITDEGKPYDFFANRLMIPIISAAGKVIGFTGRSLMKKPDHAKYKNTSTTLAFNKRKNLFGINMYKQYTPTGNRAMILVEGHMDVISLFQAGIPNVVASMGTALTPEQCREIKRYADIVYVSYDGDSAGQAATLKGLSLLKNEGLEVKVVQLSDGLDPDDYVKRFGKDGYMALVDAAVPLVDFRLRKTEEKHSFSSYDDRTKYVREAVSVLNELDAVEKSVYIEKVSKKSGLSPDRIEAAMQAEESNENAEERPSDSDEVKPSSSPTATAETYVLSGMVFGKSFVRIGDVSRAFFTSEGHTNVFDYVISCASSSTRPIASRVYDLTDKADADAIMGAMDQIKPENQETYYEQCVQKMRREYFDKKLKDTIALLSTETDPAKREELKKSVIDLTQKRK